MCICVCICVYTIILPRPVTYYYLFIAGHREIPCPGSYPYILSGCTHQGIIFCNIYVIYVLCRLI